MTRRILAASVSAVGLLIVAWSLANALLLPAAPAADDKDVFGLTKLWAIHIDIPAKEYEALQPPAGFGFGFPGQPKEKAKKEKDKRDRDRNLFGTEFAWVHGDLTAIGKTYKKVGLRYDGNA